MRFIFPISFPFVLAYLISRLVRPISRSVRSKSPVMDKPVTVFVILVIFFLLFIVCRIIVFVIADQLTVLASNLITEISLPGGVIDRLFGFFKEISLFANGTQDVNESSSLFITITRELLSYVSSFAAETAGSILASLPSLFIGFFVMLTATFYFSLDRGGLSSFLSSYIPKEYREKLTRYRSAASDAVFGFLKTYILMMLVVFTVLYLGLTVIGIEYSFVIAIITAVVDLLPILGVGTILVPWALAAFILGEIRIGVALFILFAIVTLVRELLEPKIIGGYIGLHPILSLISVYFGMRLFGVSGLIFSPILLSMILSVIKVNKEKKSEAPPVK